MTIKILVIAFGLAVPAFGQSLTLTRTIPLPGLTGKLDHSSLDLANQRLFVSAWGQNCVAVVDLRAGKLLRTIAGLPKPQGLLYVPKKHRLYVATEGDGALHILNGDDYSSVAVVRLGEDADNVRFDPAGNRIYVGYEAGALGIIDAQSNLLIKKVALAAHPEAFALAAGSPLVLMNTPDSQNVTIYDRVADKIVGEWPMRDVKDNFTIALDEANGRAFIGSRQPAKFFVFDLTTGQRITELPLHGGADDFHYDRKRKLVYASCGEGYIDVYSCADAQHYALKGSVKSAPGGRTSAFDGNTIYLNVQSGPGQNPEVRCYAIQ